jgi:hypothetical protein
MIRVEILPYLSQLIRPASFDSSHSCINKAVLNPLLVVSIPFAEVIETLGRK